MSDKNIHQKINISLPASIMTGALVEMTKQRIMLTEIPEVKWIRYMRSHNSGNIQAENLHIWTVERKKSFLENENIFSQKNYTTIIRTYWATECESRSEIEFWATCHNVSNLCDGCWHPLLSIWARIITPYIHYAFMFNKSNSDNNRIS